MRKRCMRLILFVAMLMFINHSLNVQAATTEESSVTTEQKCGENLAWTFADGTLTISGTGKMYDWQRIDMEMMEEKTEVRGNTPWDNIKHDIYNVVIEEGVTNIGAYAFLNCDNLNGILIPHSVTRIEEYAFDMSGITNIDIPDSVTSIGYSAFSDCKNLTSIDLPNSVTSLGDYMFFCCSNLKHATIPDNITRIPDGIFLGCINLATFEIPINVNEIGSSAFEDCAIESIKIPDKVTKIGPYAFERCSKLVSIEIPGSVLKIESETFNKCYNLSRVAIPDSVKYIEEYAFQECTSLSDIELPDSLEEIGYAAFQKSGLTSIVVPKSVNFLGRSVFSECYNLVSAEILYGVTSGVGEIPYHAFENCYNLEEVTMSYSVTKIAGNAFEGCTSLRKVVFPDSVKEIEWNAFAGCTSLKNIVIPPNSLTQIYRGAFSGCGLTNIVIPNSVTTISAKAFENCTSLKKAKIPESVTSIADDAFSGCAERFKIIGAVGSYAQSYAIENHIRFEVEGEKNTSITVEGEYEVTAEEIDDFLGDILQDKNFAQGKIDGLSIDFTMKGNTYTFTPLNIDFAAGMQLSNLKYQAVIDTENKKVKVLLGVSKDGKSEIIQTTDMNSTSWGEQYQSIKKMYKDLTGYDKKTTRATWNNFEKMKAQLNDLKSDMFVSVDMKVTGYVEFSYAGSEKKLKFVEGGLIEKASVDTSFSSPVVAPWVYITLGLNVSEEGTLEVKMNENVPELIEALTLSAKAYAKITGQIPIIAKVEGMIDASLIGKFAQTDPIFAIDMTGNVTLKATALAGIIDIYNNTWNYVDCQLYPVYIDKTGNEAVAFSSTDEMLNVAAATERISEERSIELEGEDFTEEKVYEQNDAELIPLENGHKLLLWLDDNKEKTDNNRTSLMYSVYDGMNWTVPGEVYGDGCFNGEFAYYTGTDGNVYVVYQKGNYIFSDDTEYTEVIRNIDPYVTVFDGNTFSTPVKVRNENNSYEDNFQIKLAEDKLCISYVEYTSDYLNGTSESMRIVNSVSNGIEWQENEVCTEEKFISGYAYAENQLYVEVYNAENSCYELYRINGTEELLTALTQDVELESDGNYLYYVDNSILTVLNITDKLEYELPYGTDYEVVTNGSETRLLYEVIQEDHSTQLYYAPVTCGILGDITIFKSDDKFIKTYRGCIDTDGTLRVVTTSCTLNEDLSLGDCTLHVSGREVKNSLSTTYLYYDENKVAADKDLDFYYDVTNTGNEEISGYRVVLCDENGNILTEKYTEIGLGVGESREELLTYHIPVDFKEMSVAVQLKSADGETIYCEQETVIKHNDISLSKVDIVRLCNQNYRINCTLENDGYQNAEDVVLTVKSFDDAITKTGEAVSVASGQAYVEEVELTKEEYDSLSETEIYIEVSSSLSESNYENNSGTVDLNSAEGEGTHQWVLDENGKYICSICGKSKKYTVTVTSEISGADTSDTVAVLTGGGNYEAGTEVTVTAAEKEGFSFKGWYKVQTVEETEPLNKKLSYTFTLEENTDLVAVYTANAKILLSVNGERNAFSVNGVLQAANNYTRNLKGGSAITVKYTGNGIFCYWRNDSGKIVSRDQEYTFTLVGATSLTAVIVGGNTGSDENGYNVLVEFVSDYGQVMQATTWNSKDSATEKVMPTGPSKLGEIFKYWSIDGTTEVTTEKILNAMDAQTSRITVKPVYEKKDETYTVRVCYNGDDALTDCYIEQKAGTPMSVTAKSIAGKKFSHWSLDVAGEKVIGTSERYFFAISGDMELYANYVEENVDVVPKPVISITNQYAFEENNVKKVGFVANRDVPERYIVEETGVLYGTNTKFAGENAESELVVGGTNLKQMASNNVDAKGVYILTVRVDGHVDTVIYVRGYITVKDKETGRIETIYSEIVSASYESLKAD